jgi:hypothetical protein
MKYRIMAVALAAILSACGCENDPGSTLTAKAPKTATIPFSFAWDVESNLIVHPNKGAADFFWNNVSEAERRLTTQAGAKAAIVKGKRFEDITAKYILGQKLKPLSILQSVTKKDLEPGTVVIFQTVEGNIGKLIVEKYRSLHDLDFPEATSFTEAWRTAAKEREDYPECHIQVKCLLYK